MRVMIRDWYGAPWYKTTVAPAVVAVIRSDRSCPERTTAEMLGRLIEALADNGLLSDQQVIDIIADSDVRGLSKDEAGA